MFKSLYVVKVLHAEDKNSIELMFDACSAQEALHMLSVLEGELHREAFDTVSIVQLEHELSHEGTATFDITMERGPVSLICGVVSQDAMSAYHTMCYALDAIANEGAENLFVYRK